MRQTIPLALLAVLAVAGCGTGAPFKAAAPASTPPAATTAAPKPPHLSAQQINKQDRVSAAHKRREAHAMASRPLLDHLPMSVGDVVISIDGLAADNRTTIITVDPGNGTPAHARAVYRDALHAYADSGRAYKPEVTR